MPSEASIYSLIRQPQAPQNPIEQYGQTLQLKNLIGQGKIQDMALADEAATRAAYQASGGDPVKLKELLYGGGQYKAALAAEKSGLDITKTKGDIEKNKQEIIAKSLLSHRDMLTSVNDPQTAAQWVLSGFNDPNLSPIMQKAGSPQEVISRIPQDPQGFAQWKLQNGQGIEKFLEMTKPDWKTVDTGGQIIPKQMNPNAPGFSSSPIPKTAAPGDKRPFQITDAAGNTKLVDTAGNVIKDLGNVGKPTATYEKTVAAKKKLASDLDQSIRELEKATADGGLIDKSTGSGIGAGVDWTASLVGKATPGSIAVGAMKPIADLVLKMVPRFEGPQSDKDTQSYKEAAGDLANPNIPNERKKIAGREILRLMKARRGQFISKDIEGTEMDNPEVKSGGWKDL
jgi:hypothetical protein